MIDINDMFNKFKSEYLKYERIDNPPSGRHDICAFLLLDKLVPSNRNIISGTRYDTIYLDVDINELEKVATKDDVLYLIRCGVQYEYLEDTLFMHV